MAKRDILLSQDSAEDTAAVSWWKRNVLLIVLAAFLLIGALSYVLFNVDRSTPGRGKGEPVSGTP